MIVPSWLAAIFRRPTRDGGRASEAVYVDPLTTVIAAYGSANPNAFFIQVGSNDGEKLDPLRREIRDRAWSGVMIEPVPYVFARLQRNHGGNPRLVLEQVAIADREGSRVIYYLPEASDPLLPDWYDALASFRKDVVLKHRQFIPDIDERIAELEVPCVTFDGLCAKHGIAHVDLIHIDTEGYDFEIIKLIDLDRLRPTVLMFEHYHMDRVTWDACIELMSLHGYEHISNGMDTLCLRTSALDPGQDLITVWQELRADPALAEPPART